MKSGRTALLILLTLGWLVAPLASEAQQAGRVYRLGYLSQGSMRTALPETRGIGLSGLRRGLRDLGWTEGENLVIEARFTEGKSERLAGLVTDLVRLNVDAIVATDTLASVAAKKATTTVPIVVMSGDPVAAGLVASLAKPGGNVTGIANQMPEARVKAIQTFLEAVPGISEIGYLVPPNNPAVRQSWQAVNAVAPRLGVKMRRFDVSQPAELETVIATAARERIGGLVVPGDERFVSQRGLIGALAAKYRLPWLASFPILVEAGALMSYGPDHRHQWQRVVWYVDRILKGAKPADLPVEQLSKFELAINLKTAKALGLTIPPSLLLRADHVIE
jgi:putative tryptophan/tyrosine transport system substrate-binding protein